MPEENIQPAPTISPELPETSTSRYAKKSTKITILVIMLLVLFSMSAFAFVQYDKIQKSKFADLNPTPTPTLQPTVSPEITVSATSTPTPPVPTLSMTFQELIASYCKEIKYPTGGSSYEFSIDQLPVTKSTESFSFTENYCSTLVAGVDGYGGYINQQLSNDLNVWFINSQSRETGHGGAPFWDPIGIEIYEKDDLTLYAFVPLGDVGPGPTLTEVYVDIRGIKNITLSNGEEITLSITKQMLIPQGNTQFQSIMQKYTKEIFFEDGSGDSMIVVDGSKDSLYYEEIYNTFFKDLSQTDPSIKSIVDTVTNTLNSFVPR